MSTRKAHVHVQPDGAIHVRVAPETLYSIEDFQAVQRAVLGRFGCPACHSGLPILWQAAEQEFELSA
jgi:hypothetical protein